MRINTNISAMRTHSSLVRINMAQKKSLVRLSSGRRINGAADDAAGLSISERMRNQISGFKQARRNAQDAVSLVQTAEGALSETHLILNRIRDLVNQASNDTYTLDDRKMIQIEINELLEEIQRISNSTQFNNKDLLKGSEITTTILEQQADLKAEGGSENLEETNETEATKNVGKSFTFQIGPNAGDTISLTIQDMGLGALGIDKLDVAIDDPDRTNPDPFGEMLSQVDSAIKKVSKQRTHLGAFQNRLDHVISHIDTMEMNLTEAHSRIVDVDMAEEMMNFTKQNIQAQATMAMLAQANQMPNGLLQLLNNL